MRFRDLEQAARRPGLDTPPGFSSAARPCHDGCIAAQGSLEHADLEILAPSICARCCAGVVLCSAATPRRPAQRASWRAVAQRLNQRAKAGGNGVCYSSHGLPTRQRSTLCGHCELATSHSSCVERITPRVLARPPCPVARPPFSSSCTRVRKRDEIMSVLIRTQAVHESALALSSDTVCCSVPPRPSAKVRTSMSCTQSLAIHDSRHTAETVSAQWGPKCQVEARRPAGSSMQRAIADTAGHVHLPCDTQTWCRMNELMLQLV